MLKGLSNASDLGYLGALQNEERVAKTVRYPRIGFCCLLGNVSFCFYV